MKYSYKTRTGRLTLRRRDNTVIAEFEGNVCGAMTQYFRHALMQCRAEIAAPFWGYVSDSKNAQAATPDAYQQFVAIGRICIEQGCRCSAYVLNSAIAKRQIDKMRQELQLDIPLQKVLFQDLDKAVEYVQSQLADMVN